MRIAIVIALAALLGAAPLLGCAHETRTITTTETLECAGAEGYGYEEAAEDYEDELDRDCTQIRRETIVTTETGSDCHGAVSCSFSLVGQLVSLPFRILGAVLDAIF